MKTLSNTHQLIRVTGTPVSDRCMLALPVNVINEWSICNYSFYRSGEYI